MRPVRLIVLGGAVAVAASGCLTYVPANLSEVRPGQEVRLRLTAEEAARYPDLRLRSPRLMEGTLVEATDGEVVVEASIGGDPSQGTRILVQQVSVPRSAILEVELRELNRARTGLLVAGGGAVLTAVIIKSGGGFGRNEGPGGGVEEARWRIPLVGFSLPLGGR